jgi:thiamine biosynthesis lipoprotein
VDTENKRSLQGLAYVAAGQAAAAVLGTVFWLLLIFVVHPVAYGHVSWLFSIAMLASSVCTLGLGVTAATFYPAEKNDRLPGTVALIVLGTGMLGGVVTTASLALTAKAELLSAAFTGVLVAALSLFSVQFHFLLGKRQYARYMWLWIGVRTLALLLPLALWLAWGMTSLLLLGLLLPYFLFGLPALRSIGDGVDFRSIDGKAAFSMKAWLSGLCGAAVHYLDKILIGLMFPLWILAAYQFAYRIFLLLAILPNTLFFYLLPEKSGGNEAKRVEIIGVALSIFLSLAAFLSAARLTAHIFPSFDEGVDAIRIMSLALVPMTVAKIRSSALLSQKKAGLVLAANLFAIIVGTAGILFVFRGGFGLRGLAGSMLAVQSGLAAGLFFPSAAFRGRVFPFFARASFKGKIVFVLSALLIAALLAVGFRGALTPGSGPDEAEQSVSGVSFAMDTVVSIRILTSDERTGRALLKEAFDEVERIEKLMNAEDSASEIYALNAASGKWVEVSPEVLHLLRRSKEYGDLTGGAFDVTIKPLVDFWMQEVKRRGTMPSGDETSAFRKTVSYERILIDEPNGRAMLEWEGMALTLGGIAKGYAIDRVCDMLKERGVESALVEIGGEMHGFGPRIWRIGVADPRSEGRSLGVIPLRNASVATSGDYRRYHLLGNERIHHILDPRTARPASGLMSVTVVTDDSLSADALSTGVFVLGAEQGLELLDGTGTAGLLIDPDGKIIESAVWKEIFGSPGWRE